MTRPANQEHIFNQSLMSNPGKPGHDFDAYERYTRGCKFAPGCKYTPGCKIYPGANTAHEHGFK